MVVDPAMVVDVPAGVVVLVVELVVVVELDVVVVVVVPQPSVVDDVEADTAVADKVVVPTAEEGG